MKQSAPKNESREKNTRYDNVQFTFFTHEKENCANLRGTVLVRVNEMILDIQDKQAPTPYLIRGALVKNYYIGTNEFKNPYTDIDAKWAQVGDSYVGIWIEEGTDYLFSFKTAD